MPNDAGATPHPDDLVRLELQMTRAHAWYLHLFLTDPLAPASDRAQALEYLAQAAIVALENAGYTR